MAAQPRYRDDPLFNAYENFAWWIDECAPWALGCALTEFFAAVRIVEARRLAWTTDTPPPERYSPCEHA